MLLPVLKPSTWEGLEQGARAHVWIGTPSQPVVIVAYADFDGDRALEFITGHNDPYHGDIDALANEAFENLEHYHTDFEVVEVDGNRMLVSAGWPFASERLLCQSHMLRAHEELDADEIVVSVTRRGSLLACEMKPADSVMASMVELHLDNWNDPETWSERVFDQLVVVENGVMVGTRAVSLVGGDPTSAWGPQPAK